MVQPAVHRARLRKAKANQLSLLSLKAQARLLQRLRLAPALLRKLNLPSK